jgi:hypothetical protein
MKELYMETEVGEERPFSSAVIEEEPPPLA